MKVSILIPCLNEIDTITEVVENARSAGKKYLKKDFEIIIADNGSTDGTLEQLSLLKNIKVINVPIKGYGSALNSGILSSKYPYILFADADLSYDFHDIDKFLKYIKTYDVVLGSRLRGRIDPNAMPLLNRYIGTPILTLLIKAIYGLNATDCNSGMRAVKKEFYKKLVMKNSGMEWASELLIKTALKGGKYIEVPINFHKDKRKKTTHLKRWEDGWRHLKVIILLKPMVLILLALVIIVAGLFFVTFSVFTTLALFLFAEFLIFSYLAAIKLESAVMKTENKINIWLGKLPLVLFSVLITTLGAILLFTISDKHLFTKYILLFQIVLFDLWLFFIETIKTHLINPLPDNI